MAFYGEYWSAGAHYPPSLTAWTHGGQDIPKSLREPRAEVRTSRPKLFNEAFLNEFNSGLNMYCAVSGAVEM